MAHVIFHPCRKNNARSNTWRSRSTEKLDRLLENRRIIKLFKETTISRSVRRLWHRYRSEPSDLICKPGWEGEDGCGREGEDEIEKKSFMLRSTHDPLSFKFFKKASNLELWDGLGNRLNWQAQSLCDNTKRGILIKKKKKKFGHFARLANAIHFCIYLI